jgi:cell division septation protein DedD
VIWSRRFLAPIVLVAGLAVLAGWGGSASPMSRAAATELQDRVAAVRTAVDARDADQAARALDDLRAAVERLRAADGISDTRAADILAAAHAVDGQLVSITTTTTTTTTTTAAPPAPPPTEPDHVKGKGPGKGKGKGGPG